MWGASRRTKECLGPGYWGIFEGRAISVCRGWGLRDVVCDGEARSY